MVGLDEVMNTNEEQETVFGFPLKMLTCRHCDKTPTKLELLGVVRVNNNDEKASGLLLVMLCDDHEKGLSDGGTRIVT